MMGVLFCLAIYGAIASIKSVIEAGSSLSASHTGHSFQCRAASVNAEQRQSDRLETLGDDCRVH